jgi:HEAT repeat protein
MDKIKCYYGADFIQISLGQETMSSGNDTPLKLVKPADEGAHRRGSALGDMYKAIKAISFYPKGHPLRSETQSHAHQALLKVITGDGLVLVVSRSGFTTTDGGASVETNPMVQALGKDLFTRRVKRLTLLPDLSLRDLRIFLRLLTMEPQKIQATGGMESMMEKEGVLSIWANDLDLSHILEKRQSLEAEIPPEVRMDSGEEEEASVELPPVQEQVEMSFAELLQALDKERDDNAYLKLAGMLASKGEELKGNGEFMDIFPGFDLLQKQSEDERRSSMQREYAIFTIEQLASGKMTDFLLEQVTSREPKEQDQCHAILRLLGTKVAYVIIQRLCVADTLFTRKALATALVKIGTPALPALLTMLQDDRWYVVRNIVAILGEINDRTSLAELKKPAIHPDERVRKETIRSLVKIGGKDAETIIISLLHDKDPGIVQQAILSLGIMKSQMALPPLMDILLERDVFLKNIELKLGALQAIGRIGDKRATPHLITMLNATNWLAMGKGDELKIAAASALGQIGDEAALGPLKARASRSGRLGKTCAEAVDNIERLAEATYE